MPCGLEPSESLQAHDWALLTVRAWARRGFRSFCGARRSSVGDARHIGILSYLTPLASTALLVVVSGRLFSACIALATTDDHRRGGAGFARADIKIQYF